MRTMDSTTVRFGENWCILPAGLPRNDVDSVSLSTSTAAPGRLRIGVVSAFLDGNTIGRLWGNLIRRLDPNRFEVFLYVYQDMNSEWGKRLAGSVHQVKRIPRSCMVAREQIGQDELDVLWFPEIGMDTSTYFLAFARMARVQCVSWGHPMTTGIDTVDYFLSSEGLEVPEAEYSEQLVRMRRVMAWFESLNAPTPSFTCSIWFALKGYIVWVSPKPI